MTRVDPFVDPVMIASRRAVADALPANEARIGGVRGDAGSRFCAVNGRVSLGYETRARYVTVTGTTE
jgi:hypothetical protein